MYCTKKRRPSLVWIAAITSLLIFAPSVFADGKEVSSVTTYPYQLDELRSLAPELTGNGVGIAVICRSVTYIDSKPQNDYMPYLEHDCFRGKEFSFYDPNEPAAGISPHSTAVCSLLFGQDSNAFNNQVGNFSFAGVAPQARGEIYEFWYFLINSVFPQIPPDTNIITMSMGSQFEDWWTRGIEVMAEQYGIVVVSGIGNGLDVSDPPLYPGASANVIGVGVVDSVDTGDLATELANYALAYPEHSSCGPTVDQRCKPDIVAVGNSLAADIAGPNRYEPTGNWSSYSTPFVSGTVALLTQKALQEPNLSEAISPYGGNCVIKAILMNSAMKLPYWHKGRISKDDDHEVPLDYAQGAGLLDPAGAYRQLIAGPNKPGKVGKKGWDLNNLGLQEDANNAYRLTIAEPNDKLIAVTAAWNRHYEILYPFKARPDRDQDLRLELWGLDTEDANIRTLLDYSNSTVDNVEHIYCPADVNYNDYEIVVKYADVPGPNQVPQDSPYGLAWDVTEKQAQDNIFWYDLNADGIVNPSDYIILLRNIMTGMKNPDRYLIGDINGDGKIDPNDFQGLLKFVAAKTEPQKEAKPQ
ncbi:MAG: S8 family serine peptidase [Planctomycetota bacterium]|jgi:hypothetical protein